MPFTSSCPKCQKPVTVPDGVGAASLVRCPLCEVEFELREAMGPPALVVIEARTDDGQPMVPVPVPVGAEMALAEAQPAAADLSDDDRWAAGWASADETAVAEHAEGEHAEGESDAAVFGAITGKLPPAEGGDGVSLPPRLPGVEGGEAAEPLRRRRRRPRQEHPIRVFFGCIISALLAGAVAYWGVNFFGGAKNDMLKIRLPFCSHTYQYWCWWTPWHWQAPPAAAQPKAVVANALRTISNAKAAVTPAQPAANSTQPAPTNSKPVVDPKKSKTPANDMPDIAVKPIQTVTPTIPSKPLEKPKEKPNSAKPGERSPEAKSPKEQPPAAEPKEAAPKPPANKATEPPAKEEPKAAPADADDGMPAMPDIGPKPGQAGPDAAPAPVSPQPPENPKASSPKVEKPQTSAKTEKAEKPASPAPETPAAPEEPAPPELVAPSPAVTPPAKPETTAAAGVQTPPADVVGPLHPAPYNPADLDTALEAARDNFGHPSTDITPAAYEKLRRVAEVLTLVKRPSGGALPAEQQRAIHELLRGATATAARTDKIAQSAAALLASPDASGGILLTGTVTFVGVQEKLHGAAVRIAGQAKPVSVLSGQSLSVNKDDKVLILGRLVREPAKNLAGYKGTQPLVVWGILAVKLP